VSAVILAGAAGGRARPLSAQAHPITWTLGAGFVSQQQTGPRHETAIGYTATLGATRGLTSKLRLHADARYSFDLALGGSPASGCLNTCITDGLSTTKVLSTTLSLEWLSSRHRPGLLLRGGGGMHLLAYPSPGGQSGFLPAIAGAVGFRIPFGARGAFVVEGRYDRIFGAEAGPSQLMPMLFGFEF
jgi:hypothetical protein